MQITNKMLPAQFLHYTFSFGLGVLGLGLMGIPSAMADTTFDHANPLLVTGGLGENDQIYSGETFTAPSDQYLQDFGFYLQNYYAPVTFDLTIAAWNGTSPGAVLFESAPMIADDKTGTSVPTFYSFATENLKLTPGQQYAAYIGQVGSPSTSDQQGVLQMDLSYLSDPQATPPLLYGTPYAGGYYIYYGNFSSPPMVAWGQASSLDYNEVTAFRADFTTNAVPAAVPEASTTVSFGLLLALGLGGLVIAAKRKKADAAA